MLPARVGPALLLAPLDSAFCSLARGRRWRVLCGAYGSALWRQAPWRRTNSTGMYLRLVRGCTWCRFRPLASAPTTRRPPWSRQTDRQPASRGSRARCTHTPRRWHARPRHGLGCRPRREPPSTVHEHGRETIDSVRESCMHVGRTHPHSYDLAGWGSWKLTALTAAPRLSGADASLKLVSAVITSKAGPCPGTFDERMTPGQSPQGLWPVTTRLMPDSAR